MSAWVASTSVIALSIAWCPAALAQTAAKAPDSVASQTGEKADAGAQAREDSTATVGEIIVTAQKRAENIQQVPIVVNAVDAATAEHRGIQKFTDLNTIVPGLQYNRSTNTGLVFMRGVGASQGAVGQEGSTAFYMDDVYIYAVNSILFELNNIERIEVLSGPQGTLFGRNALAGVVQIFTKNPGQEPGLDARLGYDNYDTVKADIYASTPITDNLAIDVAALYIHQGKGFGTNLKTGQDVFYTREYTIRSKMRWEPTDRTSATLTAMYDRTRNDVGVSSRLLPGSVGRDGSIAPAGFHDVNQELQSFFINKSWMVSFTLEHDLGWAQLKNVVAYQDNFNHEVYDIDQTPTFISHQNPVDLFSKTWTEELQLASKADSPITWIAGVFYLRNESGYTPARILNNPPNAAIGQYFDLLTNLDTTSISGYAQATVNLGDNTRLTGGLRYTEDRKHVYGGFFGQTGFAFGVGDQKDSWGKVTHRISLDHNFSPDLLAYIAYNSGFKAGTLNSAAPADPGVEPEVIDDIEGGIKSQLFGRRLRLNVAGFHYTYKNIQLRQVTADSLIRLINAAESEHYGVDLSFETASFNGFRFQGAAEWLHAEFTHFPGAPATRRNPAGGNLTDIIDYTGRDVLFAPKLTASVGAQYEFSSGLGDFVLAANYRYNDGFSWSIEADDRTRQKSYSAVNASLSWTSLDERVSIRLWGKNITDAEYYTFVNTSANGDYGSPADPATFGITLGMKLR